MAKLNGIGMPARDVDRIIDGAIRDVGLGMKTYSCCALSDAGEGIQGWEVRKAYTRAFGPVTKYPDHYGYELAVEVSKATYKKNKANFRVLMLSLFKAAWRDLV